MATKASNITYVIATTTFHGPGNLSVTEGTIRPADDPVVKAHPAMFQPVADAVG
jgi:hypothetical protein